MVQDVDQIKEFIRANEIRDEVLWREVLQTLRNKLF
jgi:hypothetical protein